MVETGLVAKEGHWGAMLAHGASCSPSTMCHAAPLHLQKVDVKREKID